MLVVEYHTTQVNKEGEDIHTVTVEFFTLVSSQRYIKHVFTLSLIDVLLKINEKHVDMNSLLVAGQSKSIYHDSINFSLSPTRKIVALSNSMVGNSNRRFMIPPYQAKIIYTA